MRRLAGSALALSVLAATLSDAAAEPDPWSRVPALPTGCYQADGFTESITAAAETVAADLSRQRSVNDGLSEALRAIDPMELASRQQQWMLDNPQEAMRLMQRNAALTDTVTAEVASNETLLAFQKELDGIDSRYQAALDGANAPIKAKYAELDVRAQKDLVAYGETWGYAPWAIKEFNTVVAEENKAYERVCAEWWSASGPYHAWLKRYRDHQVQRIPDREEAESVAAGWMVVALGTPEASWRPTSTLQSVHEFMDWARRVFERRHRQPVAPMEE